MLKAKFLVNILKIIKHLIIFFNYDILILLSINLYFGVYSLRQKSKLIYANKTRTHFYEVQNDLEDSLMEYCQTRDS